ncbi:hypothetical protein ACH4OT_04390 [Streptomyces murinus]|uniref:hypothetical protein n=1 Tax=Streptomyces murinus TaxID=33900 RepID=UPI00379B27F2
MTSHVEQQIAERIAAARAKAEQDKRRREELAAARKRGLGFRHAAKLRRMAEALSNESLSASGA